jgi:hypothetical protein
VATDRSWRSIDRCYLIDQVVDEPGVAYRAWDADGIPLGKTSGSGELGELLASLGVDRGQLVEVPVDDRGASNSSVASASVRA